MIQINLFIKEKQTRRLREQTYDYQRGKVGGRDKMGVWDWHVEIQYVTLNVMWHIEYQSFSCVQYFATLWTVAHQAPLSLGFSRQGYRSGLSFPSLMHACMLSLFSRVWLCATLWTAAHQTPPPTGFSRQEYWSGLPFPSPQKSLPLEKYWSHPQAWWPVQSLQSRAFC